MLIAGALFLATVPALADNRSRANDLQSHISAAQARERQLSAQVESVTGQIRTLEATAVDVSTRLRTLQTDLDLHRQRLAKIQELYTLQTGRLRSLERQMRIAQDRLAQRAVNVYEQGQPSQMDVILGAKSISSMLDSFNAIKAIAALDTSTIAQVRDARTQTRSARKTTALVQTKVAGETRVIAYRTQQQQALQDSLLQARGSLASKRRGAQNDLAATRKQEQEWQQEAQSLASASAQVSSTLQSSHGNGNGSLIWPVNGPITSPYGMRWGSLHPGIDIGVPMGTPIKAAAAGTILTASYNGGYGNLVVMDNGNGLGTAYAHQSKIAVSVGQHVNQGDIIGYVGSTGFSTGPHLHFEVRVNGTPVDPMGYL